jgi:hypothetical protein
MSPLNWSATMPLADRRIRPPVVDGYPDSGDGSTSALLPGQEKRRVANRRVASRRVASRRGARRRAADTLGDLSTKERAQVDWVKDFLRS